MQQGIKELEDLEVLLEKGKEKMMAHMEELFTTPGILKRWAKEGKLYCEETITYVNVQVEVIKRVFVQLADTKKKVE